MPQRRNKKKTAKVDKAEYKKSQQELLEYSSSLKATARQYAQNNHGPVSEHSTENIRQTEHIYDRYYPILASGVNYFDNSTHEYVELISGDLHYAVYRTPMEYYAHEVEMGRINQKPQTPKPHIHPLPQKPINTGQTTRLVCRVCGDIPPSDAYYCIVCGNQLR